MCKSGSSSLYQKLHPSSRGAAVQVRRHFQQGEFPSSHHREEGWPSDQENTAQHPLFARTGWCSDRTDKEHHPDGVDKEASRHFLGDAATPPRGDARRGIRFFRNDTSKPNMFLGRSGRASERFPQSNLDRCAFRVRFLATDTPGVRKKRVRLANIPASSGVRTVKTQASPLRACKHEYL